MVALLSITLVLWRMDVELGSVLALEERVMLLVIFGKRNMFGQQDKLFKNSCSHLFIIFCR